MRNAYLLRLAEERNSLGSSQCDVWEGASSDIERAN